jgi:tRNA pseudouridine55 synthase
MNGILVVDKPSGMTSHDVVQRIRRVSAERSVGHLGTLDPMATGVLPLLLGRFTRLAQFFGAADKEYEGTIRFGYATDTYDADGDPVDSPICESFTAAALQSVVASLTGTIEQVPPPFSAKKLGGVPAHRLARKGERPDLKAVKVNVHRFHLLNPNSDTTSDNAYYVKNNGNPLEIGFRVSVSAGTYVRSLAHELGKKLGCGAHLASLRRTRSGEFSLAHAVTLDKLDSLEPPQLHHWLLSVQAVLPSMPNVILRSEETQRIRHGNSTNLPVFGPAELVKVFDGDDLIAVAKRVAGTLYQPKVVLV